MKLLAKIFILFIINPLLYCMEFGDSQIKKSMTILKVANTINYQLMPNGYIDVKSTNYENTIIEKADIGVFSSLQDDNALDDLLKQLGTIEIANIFTNEATLSFVKKLSIKKIVINANLLDKIELNYLLNKDNNLNFETIEINNVDFNCEIKALDKLQTLGVNTIINNKLYEQ